MGSGPRADNFGRSGQRMASAEERGLVVNLPRTLVWVLILLEEPRLRKSEEKRDWDW